MSPIRQLKHTMQTLDEVMAKSSWTRELQPETLQRVRAALIVRDVTPGCYVCHKGDAANVWIGVVDGLVKLVSVSPGGRSVTFAAVPAGSWFGEGSVLKREARKYDVVALRESRVALMPEATFFWLLDTSIPFNRFIMNQLNERLGQFMAAFEHDRLLSPGARVARALANMCHPLLYPGHERCIELSQDEIGQLVGASRQTVSQALQVLEKAGLIKSDYRMLTVVDLEGLRRFGN
jgi:CRP-like cAMP-binding protein